MGNFIVPGKHMSFKSIVLLYSVLHKNRKNYRLQPIILIYSNRTHSVFYDCYTGFPASHGVT